MEWKAKKNGEFMMNVNEELCAYLKQHEFHEFMNLWKQQYERYGHCGGKIHVPLTDLNREDISCFMGKDYHKNSHAVIAYSTLKKAISETKFNGADFNIVLSLYYDEEILTRKDKKTRMQEEIKEFFDTLIQDSEKHYSKEWLQFIYENKNSVYLRIVQEYKLHKNKSLSQMKQVLNAIDNLPVWKNKKENISIFASQFTLDPHAFDLGDFRFYVLINAIYHYFPYLEEKDIIGILSHAGLYKDGISNFCSVYGIVAYQEKNIVHKGWKGFYDKQEILNINMENLLEIQGIEDQYLDCICIVENPSIFQSLVKTMKQNDIKKIGMICTYGQLNYSSYLLLDFIESKKIPMYYCGDMDPEGLLIAQKLINRYPSMHLWRYNIENYIYCISDKSLSGQRLKMLSKLKIPQLVDIAEMMLESKKAGYQENIIKLYQEDLVELKNKQL